MEQALGYFAALCAATLLGSLRKAPRGPSAYFRLTAGMAVLALGPGPVRKGTDASGTPARRIGGFAMPMEPREPNNTRSLRLNIE